jgi:hypothetical protein
MMPIERAAETIANDGAAELSNCAETLLQLSALFGAIIEDIERGQPHNIIRAQTIAKLGGYVADDRADCATGARERLERDWIDLVRANKKQAAAVSP